MKKRWIALLLVFALALSLTACGGNNAEESGEPSATPTEVVSDEQGETPEAASYTYNYEGIMGPSTAQFDFAEDGTCQLYLLNDPMIKDVFGGTYVREGDTITISGLTNVDPNAAFASPALWAWIVDGNATITVDDAAGTFEPAGDYEQTVLPSLDDEGNLPDGLADVAYASISDSQVCNIYTPLDVENAPVIVVLHGGGFAFGSQTMAIIQPIIWAALTHGYAVVSVDYRKSSEAVFPAALADVKAAVRFIRANAEEYGLDADHIAVWGESAGAYLALMTALTPEVAELNGDVTDNAEVSSTVTALVTFYAPVEFWTMDDEYAALGNPNSTFGTDSSFESKFLGQALGTDEEKTYTTYWETYADQLPDDFDLTAWVQVGDADQSVPYTQSVNFASRLAEVIGEDNVQFGILEGAGHEDDAFYTDENLNAVFAWLDGVMKG